MSWFDSAIDWLADLFNIESYQQPDGSWVAKANGPDLSAYKEAAPSSFEELRERVISAVSPSKSEPVFDWSPIMDYLGGLFESSGEAAEKQRVYNALEAQKERDWQEMMRQTYWQDMISGMEAAGLNPRVVFGGGSMPTTPTPTGAAATSSIPQTDTLSSMINSISSLIDAIVGAVNPIKRMESFVTSNNTNSSYTESHVYRHRGN